MHKNKWKNIQKRMLAAMLGTIIAMSSFQTVYATKQDVEAAKKKVSSIEEEKKKSDKPPYSGDYRTLLRLLSNPYAASSTRRTPPEARDNSPGLGTFPPPVRPWGEIV
jgi:hypothetical protein